VKLVQETETPVEAIADRRAVEQVLTNLLDNAAKYTNAGGHIAVRIGAAGGRVSVAVQDDGIGIPEQDLPRIFERFYRVEKARSRDLGGTGLGLSIVKHLVQAMDGEIYVESDPGRGSTFRFLLPAAEPRLSRTAP
jgi:two-component system phosphate regulon sensor histidine kinase PhoR